MSRRHAAPASPRRAALALLLVATSATGGAALGTLAACGDGLTEPATSSDGGGVTSSTDGGGMSAAEAAGRAPVDAELAACQARWNAAEAEPSEPGAPGFEARRVALLGRARGPALLWSRAPVRTPAEALAAPTAAAVGRMDRASPGVRIARLEAALKAHPGELRAAVLREGYVYAEEPLDAFELVERLTLTDLFDEPRLVLERGTGREVLTRVRHRREHRYEKADGRPAQLLFGDRIVVDGATVTPPPPAAAPPPEAPPLHVDVGAFADEAGFDRVRPLHLTARTLLAELRVAPAGRTVRAVLERDGARLDLACLVEPRAIRDAVVAAIEADAWRRRAISALRAAVDEAVHEGLPFDRPREVEGPDRDGELRPRWASAYLGGRHAFEVDDVTYPVFTSDGRPFPPQVCVDFVLDTWERASGRWYRPRGEARGRAPGRLDLDAEEIPNRRGVLGFGDFAASRPDLFDVRRFEGRERVPFAQRDQFLDGLCGRSGVARGEPDLFRPGDVVAIHGLKRDDRVHQHAILVEGVDPVSGLPHALADQMKRPRRRTWEGIMAEAPRRSLLYRARPREPLLRKLDGG